MDDRILKPGQHLDAPETQQNQEQPQNREDLSQLREMSQTVSEGVNVLSESADEGGVFSEEEKKSTDQGSSAQSAAQKAQIAASVKQLPPVEIMIRQTVEAIEMELKNTQDEVKTLMRDKKSSPYALNDKVRRIRFLNGLLSQMKRAAKMAEEFVVNLWKQFVGKSS